MIKWLVRASLGLAALIVLAVAGGAGYLWYQGSQAMSRAETAGWFDPSPSDAPLSVFEATVAKVEFGDTWNQTGFPCRNFARLTGIFAGGRLGGMPVSQMLARDIQFSEKPEQSIASRFHQLALGCELESAHSDTELLRIWLRRAYFGYVTHGAEAASQAAFQKPSSELGLMEAAELVTMLRAPGLEKRAEPERWNALVQATLEHAEEYDWDGTTMTRIGGAQ